MMTAGRDRKRPLGCLLAAYVGEIDIVFAGDGEDLVQVNVVRLERKCVSQETDGFCQVADRDDVQRLDDGGTEQAEGPSE